MNGWTSCSNPYATRWHKVVNEVPYTKERYAKALQFVAANEALDGALSAFAGRRLGRKTRNGIVLDPKLVDAIGIQELVLAYLSEEGRRAIKASDEIRKAIKRGAALPESMARAIQ